MIYFTPAALATLGLVLIILTWDEPRYSNPAWAKQFDSVGLSPKNSDVESQRFYAVQTQYLTPASHRADLGRILFAFGVSATVLVFVLRKPGKTRARELSTPGHRGLYYLADGAWLAFVPAQWMWLSYTYDRRDYPPWADDIPIPGFSYLMVFTLLLPIVHAGTYLCARGAGLPCRLFDPGVGWRALVAPALLVVPTFFIYALGEQAFLEGDHFTAAVLPWALYAILSLRAAGASSRA